MEHTSKLGTKFVTHDSITREKYREYKTTVNKLLGTATMTDGKVTYNNVLPDSLEEMDDIAVRLGLRTINGEEATEELIKALDWKDFAEIAAFIQKHLFTTGTKK